MLVLDNYLDLFPAESTWIKKKLRHASQWVYFGILNDNDTKAP